MTNELKWLDARCPKCSGPAVLLGTTVCTAPGCDHFENHELPRNDTGASLLTAPDPLTIAYLTIGAYDVLKPLYEGSYNYIQLDALSAHHGGQVGIINAIADLAGELDESTKDFHTERWAYDVCEPIGATLMREGLRLGSVPVLSHAKLIIKDHMMKLNEKPLAPLSLPTAPTTTNTPTK